ncbi:MAG: 23S rRNA (adenine(1618)-N(6))-methyltransferase RlmF [Bacteroidales bacterium]|nr:23S rRNA (adenine(1618)-N(6))-methyltransferase RlmF [Bacteroidales bacterium]
MQKKIKHKSEIKTQLHPRNKHRERYDLDALSQTYPALKEFIITTEYGKTSIDFFNNFAVKALNIALLKHYYNVDYWDIPPRYLVPPIPGRADYLHYVADLLALSNKGNVPRGSDVKCFDIGVGASCVYPIIGVAEYGWSFVCSEIDKKAFEASAKIIEKNAGLSGLVNLKLQEDKYKIFDKIIAKDDLIDVVICNPPFHASLEEAKKANLRKLSNLKRKRANNEERNFGGVNQELWCVGGERKFVKNMIHESLKFGYTCFWFTSLISKDENVFYLKKELERVKAKEIKLIPMGQGNKISRILAWTFQTKEEQEEWAKTSWK